MFERPKISVLIPTYNYARFLPEAVESVLHQYFKDFELLICDDHSTDNSTDILKGLARSDDRLRIIIHAKNLGMVENWNFCLSQARGEYVKFLFGDDKLARPDCLQKLAQMLDANPHAVLASSAREIMDEHSTVIDFWKSFSDGLHPGREVMIRCLMEHANLIGEPSAVMFRRSEAGQGFNPAYRQIVDLDFWFRLLEKGDLIYTREPLCGFRQHGLQQTVRNEIAGAAWKEHLMFAAKFVSEPWMPRKALFPILYEFRRSVRKRAEMRTPELRVAEQSLATRLGESWYRLYLIKHRFARPFQNLAHSIEKRTRKRSLADYK